MNENKMTNLLGTFQTPTDTQLHIYELEGNDKLFVLLTDVVKSFGYKNNCASPNSLIRYAIDDAKKKVCRFLWSHTKSGRIQIVRFLDLADIPDIIENFIRRAKENIRAKKDNLPKAQVILSWLNEKIMPLFYENESIEESKVEDTHSDKAAGEQSIASELENDLLAAFDAWKPYYVGENQKKPHVEMPIELPDKESCANCPLFQKYDKKCEYDRKRRREMSPEQREEYREKQRIGFHNWYNNLSAEEKSAYIARGTEYGRKWRLKKLTKIQSCSASLF